MTTTPAPARPGTRPAPIQVAPRWLAGPGRAAAVFGPLADADWHVTPIEPGTLTAIHPSGRILLRYAPRAEAPFPDDGLATHPPGPASGPAEGEPVWRLVASDGGERPAWAAHFGARTPAELLAAATAPLRTAVPERLRAATGGQATQLLEDTGWSCVHGPAPLPHRGHATQALGADGLLQVRHARPADAAGRGWTWNIRAVCGLDGPALWTGELTSTIPHPLLAALLTALADPTPLPREGWAQVPAPAYPFTRNATTPTH